MNRLSKAILFALAALLALAAVLLLSLNLYVQSPGTQARIQEELSKALKLPLVITNTSLTPWSDLRINGITVPAEGGNFLEAASFSARYRLLPMFRKRLVIYDMRLDGPKIVWVQNADKKWALPTLVKSPDPSGKKAEQPKAKAPPADKRGDLAVQLDGAKISHGSIEFLNEKRERVALFTDVDLHYTFQTPERGQGHLTVVRIAYGAFIFENVLTPFSYSAGEIEIPAIEALLAGGPLTGSLRLSPDAAKSPFAAALKFHDVDVARLSTEAGWTPGQMAGTLAGELELHGSSDAVEKGEGKGQLTLRDGQLRQLEFFQTIGQLLQIDGLTNLRPKLGTAVFRIADEKTMVDELVLEAPDIKLSARGKIGFDGKLALDAHLALSHSLATNLPTFVRETFSETDAAGQASIGFKITGKSDRPHTDLAEKLVGKKLGEQFGNVISKLFEPKKKKEDDKKKDEKKDEKKKKKKSGEPMPAAAPAATPPAATAPAAEAAAESAESAGSPR